jgi:hypothetical protein
MQNLIVRLDNVPTEAIDKKKFTDQRGKKRTYVELSVDLHLTVKNAVTIEVRRKNLVLASLTTPSL